ncbi:MAG TPA: MATE family efflux transporter [Cellvibrionaceae bacterium]
MLSNTRHLTHGIWPLAWPIILSNLSVPLLGAVDTAILGHLPSARYLAAVAAGSVLLSLLLWSFGFLRMGTTSLVARAVGAGDTSRSIGIGVQAVGLALLLALVLMMSQFFVIPLALGWITPDAEVAALAASYCHIRLLSAPVTLINYVLIGWFIGQQDTRRPLIILVSANLLNIALDFWLIMGLGLNSNGAAWATVIAEYLALGLGLVLLWHKLGALSKTLPGALTLRAHCHWLTRWGEYLPLLQVNRHLFVRTLCLLGVLVFFAAQGARLGTVVLAANAILLQFLMLTAHGLDGFAHATEALSGKAVGARNRPELLRISLGSSLLALVTAAIISAIFWLGRDLWLGLFSSLPEVLAQAQGDFFWVVVLPLVAVGAYQLDGIFLGSGHTRAMQNAMLLCIGGVFLPVWLLSQQLGNTGLWLAFTLFNLARGLSLGWIFYRRWRAGRWIVF